MLAAPSPSPCSRCILCHVSLRIDCGKRMRWLEVPVLFCRGGGPHLWRQASQVETTAQIPLEAAPSGSPSGTRSHIFHLRRRHRALQVESGRHFPLEAAASGSLSGIQWPYSVSARLGPARWRYPARRSSSRSPRRPPPVSDSGRTTPDTARTGLSGRTGR